MAKPGYPKHELLRAPSFFLGRTASGNVWRLRDDLPDDLAAELANLCRREPPLGSGQTEPQLASEVRLLLPLESKFCGPAYLLPEQTRLHNSPAIVITNENKHLLAAHFAGMLERPWESRVGPVAASLEGGQVVAVCSCVRFTPHVAEAGLRTSRAFRGRGHALAAAGLWARCVQELGRSALYSTDWANLVSQRVAARLGAAQYGEDWSLG